MNALVKKEIRLLLPSFLIGVALAFANGFLKADDQLGSDTVVAVVSIVACAGIAVFTALNSFGAEISAGTFSMLLAQPVSRQRIWRTKAWLLAVALSLGGFLWCAVLFARFQLFSHPKGLGDFWEIFLGTWVFLAVVYSGALWTVLLLRQMAAAFWFTLLTPGAILMVITGLWPEKYSAASEPAAIAGLLIYSLAGFWFARRLFLRAQDVAWTGGNIVWPEIRGSATIPVCATEKRIWRPRAALFWKEVQLHQSQFVLAGALALLHLIVLAARKFGSYQRNSAMEFILEIFWGLWLVMPMLVGAAAVAEERKLGTLAGQLCLPIRRRKQFVMKLRVVLLLTVLFGVALPLLLEGPRILPDVHFFPNGFHFENADWLLMNTWQGDCWICLAAINSLTPLLALLGMAIAIGVISFYASTLTRNTLQALAPAVLGIVLFAFLCFNAVWPELLFHYPVWHGALIYFIGLPVLAIALIALAFWNCQRTDPGWNIWRRNGLVFVAALAFIFAATTAIYHRAWEKLTPFEPAHGAARLTMVNPAKVHDQWNTLTVRLPDGRMWTDDYGLNIGAANPLALVLGDIRLVSQGGGHFLEGSNWLNLVRGVRMELAGIKTDGTLWVSEKPAQRERLAGGGWKMSKAGGLVRFGGETNWSTIVQHGLSMLLVKNDGTLWHWGILTNWNWKTEWPGLQAFTQQRVGTESNWVEGFNAGYQVQLRKTDGSLWTVWNGDQNQKKLELMPGFSVERWAQFDHGKWRTTANTWAGLGFGLCVCEDGTFRIYADQKLNKTANTYDWTPVDLQFGKETNWLCLAGRGEKIVTLKNDGTLWLWNFHHDQWRGWNPERDEREMLNEIPVRLGTHADWIAIASAEGGIISLAADGSLWYWPLESADYFMSELGNRFWDSKQNAYFEPLLDISREPQFLGNVFSRAD